MSAPKFVSRQQAAEIQAFAYFVYIPICLAVIIAMHNSTSVMWGVLAYAFGGVIALAIIDKDGLMLKALDRYPLLDMIVVPLWPIFAAKLLHNKTLKRSRP